MIKEKEKSGVATGAKGGAKSFHLFFGADEYEVEQEARALIDQLCPKESQVFGLEVVDGAVATVEESVTALNACLSALRTVGFLSESKVVWLKNAGFFAMDKIGRSERVVQAVEGLTAYLKAGLAAGVHLVVTAQKVYKVGSFYKAAKTLAEVKELQLEERTYKQDDEAMERASAYFREAGLSPANEVLVQFVERTGSNMRQMVQDIEKISVYLGGEKEVTAEVVDLLVPPTREALVWSLPESVAKRDLGATRRMLRRLVEQKENAVGMIISVEKQFGRLSVLRACLDRGWARIEDGYRKSVAWAVPAEGEALLEALGDDDPRKMHPYAQLLALQQAQEFTAAELAWCKEKLSEVHYQMMNSPVPPDLQLELVLLEIITQRSKKRKA